MSWFAVNPETPAGCCWQGGMADAAELG